MLAADLPLLQGARLACHPLPGPSSLRACLRPRPLGCAEPANPWLAQVESAGPGGPRGRDARGAAMRVQGGWKSPAVGRGLAGRGRGRRPEASRTQARGPDSRRAASAGRGGQRGA